jgi:hypothetical protein
VFSCGALRTAVCTAVLTIIAYSASAGAAFEGVTLGGRALASASPSAEPFPSGPPPEPSFSVDASRETGRPGDAVRIAFAVNDTGWAIDGCTARFANDVPHSCVFDANLDASVDLNVPADAPAGSMPINWTISYHALPKESGGSSLGTQGGNAFVVLPPVAKVVSPSPAPDESAGGGGPLVTDPPGDVAPVERPRTVPSANHGSLPIGVPLLLVVLAAGGIAVALIAGRKHAGAETAGAASLGVASPGGDEVRVVPRPGPGVQVTVREPHRSLTNVVRLEPRSGVAMVDVEERK